MRNFEVTFIVDPVLSNDEIKETAQTYVKSITEIGGNIVFIDEMGLRQLALTLRNVAAGFTIVSNSSWKILPLLL